MEIEIKLLQFVSEPERKNCMKMVERRIKDHRNQKWINHCI